MRTTPLLVVLRLTAHIPSAAVLSILLALALMLAASSVSLAHEEYTRFDRKILPEHCAGTAPGSPTITDMQRSEDGSELTLFWAETICAESYHIYMVDNTSWNDRWMSVGWDYYKDTEQQFLHLTVDPERTYQLAVRACGLGGCDNKPDMISAWSPIVNSTPPHDWDLGVGVGNASNIPSTYCSVKGSHTCAAGFTTGGHASGYTLGSVKMLFATGTQPSNGQDGLLAFLVGGTQDHEANRDGPYESDPLGTGGYRLQISTSQPARGGWHMFTCAEPSGCPLQPSSDYFVVLNSSVLDHGGVYKWCLTDSPVDNHWPLRAPWHPQDEQWSLHDAFWTDLAEGNHADDADMLEWQHAYKDQTAALIMEVSLSKRWIGDDTIQ